MKRNLTKCGALLPLAAMTLALGIAVAASEAAETITPARILNKSISYHDPNGVWGTDRTHLSIHTTYSEEFAKKAGSKEAKLMLTLSPGHEDFRYTKETSTDKIEISVRRGESSMLLNGSSAISPKDKSDFGCERLPCIATIANTSTACQ